MKKFVFPLEKVLKYRRDTLDMRKNELLRLISDLKELEEGIQSLNLKIIDKKQRMNAQLESGLAVSELNAYSNYFNELNRQIKVLNEKKQILVQAVEKKKNQIVALKGDITGLDRLKEKQLKEYAAKERKELEQSVEDFVKTLNSKAFNSIRIK